MGARMPPPDAGEMPLDSFRHEPSSRSSRDDISAKPIEPHAQMPRRRPVLIHITEPQPPSFALQRRRVSAQLLLRPGPACRKAFFFAAICRRAQDRGTRVFTPCRHLGHRRDGRPFLRAASNAAWAMGTDRRHRHDAMRASGSI